MTTVEQVHAAIAARGGRIVSTWGFGATGSKLRAFSVSTRKPSHCGGCGGSGHTVRRCNGVGREPKPLVDPPSAHSSSPRP